MYIADVAYQKYVLEHCGVSVTGTYLVTLNGDYVFDGTPDIHRLFKITDVAQRVKAEEKNIEPNLSVAERLLASKEEPDIDLADRCNQPHPCGFLAVLHAASSEALRVRSLSDALREKAGIL